MSLITVYNVNCMEKLQDGKMPSFIEYGKTVLQNEETVYTVAVKSEHLLLNVKLTVESEIKDCIKVYRLDNVLCNLPYREGADDYVILKTSGTLPDILSPFDTDDVTLRYDLWNNFCVTVNSDGKILDGKDYEISLIFSNPNGEEIGRSTYLLSVQKGILGKSELIYTNWFHYDCLADAYGLKPFSDEYYPVMEKFIANSVKHGLTMLYTPLFTPPLDTAIGGERPTVQLIDVTYADGKFSFSFDRLKKFITTAKKLGVEYFEFSHLFTQWGAEKCPKVIVNGDEKYFGWDVSSDSPEYFGFLGKLLPELNSFVKESGLTGKCFYHISDEPHGQHIEKYAKLYDYVSKLLPDLKSMDAMSDYDFYKRGLVDYPVVATSSAQTFIDNDAKGYWVYNCVTQNDSYLSNRFINMSGERTRVIGFQMYLTGVKGFLHWGYNFYYSHLSKRKLNPYVCNDADGIMTAGDPFVVYPAKDGPVNSIRIKYIRQAICDYNALCMLEKAVGREKVVAVLTSSGIKANYTDYPHSPVWLEGVRTKINLLIAENCAIDN